MLDVLSGSGGRLYAFVLWFCLSMCVCASMAVVCMYWACVYAYVEGHVCCVFCDVLSSVSVELAMCSVCRSCIHV